MTDPQRTMQSKDAEPSTAAVHRSLRARLDFEDQRDFDNARRGLIAPVPNAGTVTTPRGTKVWDLSSYAFLGVEGPDGDGRGAPDIDTVNPSLLRMAHCTWPRGWRSGP